MKKIGITGSLASGKTTASKILSSKGPLFSADAFVKKLYTKVVFKNLISRKFKLKKNGNLKILLKKKISKDKSIIKKLEKIIHPLVRSEMRRFGKINNKNKFVFFEVPLLIESKLMKNFDIIIFIKAKKSLRLRRFKNKGGNLEFFSIFNKKQLSEKKKIKYCDHVVVNESNKKILKENLLYILKKYE